MKRSAAQFLQILTIIALLLCRTALGQGQSALRQEVTFEFPPTNSVISVLGSLPELGSNVVSKTVRMVRQTTNSSWTLTASLPANRTYTYRFYKGSVPASDVMTGQTWTVPLNPSGKLVFLHSALSNPVLHWRHDQGEYKQAPLRAIRDGRTADEKLWRAIGVGEATKPIEFYLTSRDGTARDPASGTYKTPLDAFMLQDSELFTYMPAGKVTPQKRDYSATNLVSIKSVALGGETRFYRVILPRGYADHPPRRYPVMYFHDGQAIWDVAPGYPGSAVVDLDAKITGNLVRSGDIGEMIMVGVDATEGRLHDYTDPEDGGRGDKFATFLLNELKPVIDAQYRTKPGGEFTWTCGASRGGILVFYLGWFFPYKFSRIAALSGSPPAASPNFFNQIKSEPNRPIRIYLDSGEDFYSDVLAMRDALLRKGYIWEGDFRYVYQSGGQHVTQDFAKRWPALFSFLYPAAEEPNELLPKIELASAGEKVTLSWSSLYADFTVETAGSLEGQWTRIAGEAERTTHFSRLELSVERTPRFFRLRESEN